jgi:lipid II:glycine glycyltransferase (peptidoglycan interpeptide bridge formation enzyme)
MQKRILLVASAIGIVALFVAGAYYVAVFLPQKQKAGMDIVKLELEAKIEQEKTEQAKIEQENKIREEDKQKAEEEKQQKITDEANQQAEIKKKQQSAAGAFLSKCLAAADTKYRGKLAQLQDIAEKYNSPTDSGTLTVINDQRSQARNECYK